MAAVQAEDVRASFLFVGNSFLDSRTHECGDARTVPVELSKNNASKVISSIEIHIFVVISYNQGFMCRCCIYPD